MHAVSSRSYGERLELNIRPSRLLASLVLAMHATAAAIVVTLPLALLSRLVLALAVLGSLMWNGVLYWRRTPRRLLWSAEQGWRITDYRNVTREATLLPGAYLGQWFIVAHFRLPGGKRRAVVLARDSCSAEGLRRLRVLLRYGASGE